MDSPNDTNRGGFGAHMAAVEDDNTVVDVPPPLTLEQARQRFLDSINSTSENDVLCNRDLRYYHNHQISPEVKKKLLERGQPIIVDNQIKPAINGLLGVAEQMETSPECMPRSIENQNAADVATKVIRSNLDRTHWSKLRQIITKDYFLQGTCAVIVEPDVEDKKPGNERIKITPILWEDFFYDPLSRFPDFSDATYLGMAQWHDASKIAKLYPEAYAQLGNPTDTGGDWMSGKDVAERAIWISSDRKRIRVVEMYIDLGINDWQRVLFCHAGFLDFGPSVYKDDLGRSYCPIVASSFEVDRLTYDRYGAVRGMISMQDSINNQKSKLLHETASIRVQQTQEGLNPASTDIARKEASKANGVMPPGFERIPAPDIFQGNMELLREAQSSMARQAPTPAVLGQGNIGESGRQLQILQQAGLTEWSPFFANLLTLEAQVYHRIWWCARQFIDMSTWVRVTNDARTPEFVRINVPTGQMQYVQDPQTGQITPQPVIHNAIAEMDVDIELTTIPKTTTLDQETRTEILRYAAQTGIGPLDPRFKAVLMMFPVSDQQKTLDRWDAIQKQMQETAAPQQQAQQQAQQAQQQLDALHVQSKAAKDQAQAQKTQMQTAVLGADLHDRAATSALMQMVNEQIARSQAQQPPQPAPAPMMQDDIAKAEQHLHLHRLLEALKGQPPIPPTTY